MIGVWQAGELLYSYAVITVDALQQLSWMHDRMPVISYLSLSLSLSVCAYMYVCFTIINFTIILIVLCE